MTRYWLAKPLQPVRWNETSTDAVWAYLSADADNALNELLEVAHVCESFVTHLATPGEAGTRLLQITRAAIAKAEGQ